MLATRRVFRQFELVSIQIANPCPQAATIRPTRQRLLELDAFRFQDGAEPLQVGLPRNARRARSARRSHHRL